MAKLQYLVIHCTATPEGRKVSSAEIRRWHTDPLPAGRGWKQVGYTNIIHLDGSIERLVDNNEDNNVDNWEITNGVAGYNSISRHIVYVGGVDKNLKPKDTRTDAQEEALKLYVKDFQQRFPEVKIVGHNELADKDCPSFDVQQWLSEINRKPEVITVIPDTIPETVPVAEPSFIQSLFNSFKNSLKKWKLF